MYNIIFGMPTLLEISDIEHCAKLCSALDLNFIELNMNLPMYQPEKIDTEYYNFLKQSMVFFSLYILMRILIFLISINMSMMHIF